MTSLGPTGGTARTAAGDDEITVVDEELSVEAVALADFLETAGALTLADRKRLVEQALVLLEQNYVHLPLKRAMHAVEPVQALRLLRHRLELTAEDELTPESDFHREMLTIFTSVRDLHTNYLLPAPFSGAVALMPFDIEPYFADGRRRYAVSHTAPGFQHEHFSVGVDITHWNGTPIDRAVAANAERYAGSNLEARRARGIEFLTRRPLRTGLPPDEHWVTITFLDADGIEHELRQTWRVEGIPRRPEGIDPAAITTAATSLGMDLELDMSQRVKRRLFAPRADALSADLTAEAAPGEQLATTMPEYFRARSVVTAHGTFGHVRIFSFNIGDPDKFVGEFLRLIELLPQSGLIIDVRGNGGGHIHASEGLLQLLTPHAVEPEPTQFINTALNLRLCRRHRDNPVGLDLGGWTQSMEQAVETGATYSRGVPITPGDWANAIGQRYYGPVVLITDALCYSATDIFAAGFQDHGIGPVLGIDGNTGAGGANVWTHDLLSELLKQPPPPDEESPYQPLPGGAGMRVSIRRMLRVGDEAGTPLEDLGVVPDRLHRMTLDDILNGNPDLLDHAGELLAGLPARTLDATLAHSDDGAVLEVVTAALDRLDLLVDGRPFDSLDVTDGSRTVEIDRPIAASVELCGFAEGEMVACRRIAA
jgi:hypothetical protein